MPAAEKVRRLKSFWDDFRWTALRVEKRRAKGTHEQLDPPLPAFPSGRSEAELCADRVLKLARESLDSRWNFAHACVPAFILRGGGRFHQPAQLIDYGLK